MGSVPSPSLSSAEGGEGARSAGEERTREVSDSDPVYGLLRRTDAAFLAVFDRGCVLDAEGAGNDGQKRCLRHRSPRSLPIRIRK